MQAVSRLFHPDLTALPRLGTVGEAQALPVAMEVRGSEIWAKTERKEKVKKTWNRRMEIKLRYNLNLYSLSFENKTEMIINIEIHAYLRHKYPS